MGAGPAGIAADVGLSFVALPNAGGGGSASRTGPVAIAGGPRIVMGFGAERIDDMRAHEAERDANALERHVVRANEGGRGPPPHLKTFCPPPPRRR